MSTLRELTDMAGEALDKVVPDLHPGFKKIGDYRNLGIVLFSVLGTAFLLLRTMSVHNVGPNLVSIGLVATYAYHSKRNSLISPYAYLVPITGLIISVSAGGAYIVYGFHDSLGAMITDNVSGFVGWLLTGICSLMLLLLTMLQYTGYIVRAARQQAEISTLVELRLAFLQLMALPENPREGVKEGLETLDQQLTDYLGVISSLGTEETITPTSQTTSRAENQPEANSP